MSGWVGLLICHFTFRPSPAYNKCRGDADAGAGAPVPPSIWHVTVPIRVDGRTPGGLGPPPRAGKSVGMVRTSPLIYL